MHARIQLDITAEISIRKGTDGATEILILDGDASTVIELRDSKHVDQLLTALTDHTA